jgi:UDP-glucuronate decarboxylase
MIVAKVGADAKLGYSELPSDDPRQRKPDITRARDQLGWSAKVPIDQGLDSTIAYFRELLSQEHAVA